MSISPHENSENSPTGQSRRPVPAVSVILSAYNAEQYLGEAIESILAQTFTDFELLVVNDGSTDRTADIVRGYADYRVQLVTNPSNLGLAKSLNQGIAVARGRYIARQDADDFSLPERLQKQFDFMERHSQVAVLGTGRRILSSSGPIKSGRMPMASPSFSDMLKSNRIVGASAMIRKKRLDEVGGYDDFFRQADDYELWLRITKKYSVANLPEALYVVRRNQDSLTRSSPGMLTLYFLLARNRVMGVVDDELFAQIKKDGIESYYNRLSKEDKIFYHQRAAKRCMNYDRNADSLKNYRHLMKLQGASFKVVANMLKLQFRLLLKRWVSSPKP